MELVGFKIVDAHETVPLEELSPAGGHSTVAREVRLSESLPMERTELLASHSAAP